MSDERHWFEPKRYGYGATPITWQGWVVTGIAIAAILVVAWLTVGFDRSAEFDLNRFAVFLVLEAVVIAVLWVVSKRKTAGEWRWRWGRD